MLFSHQKGELMLILDVQSSIVRGTLVYTQDQAKPLVLYTHNVIVPYKVHARSGYLVKSALTAIRETLDDVLTHLHVRSSVQDIPHKISSVHYVLSTPWIVSQAKTLVYSFKENTIVDRQYIERLIADDRKKLISETGEDIRVIEEKVFDVRLNGYSVASWESRHTRELEVSFVVSVAGGRMIDRFVEACDHAVSHSKVHFHSSLFLQHVGIDFIMPDRPSYALVHVHGELTDVAIVNMHSCTFFGSFPFGVHTVVRTLAREAKINEQSADSLLRLSVQGVMDEHFANKEATIVENMSNGWIGEFRKLLRSNPSPISLPHLVIISGHSHEDFFIKCFKDSYPQHALEILAFETVYPYVDFDPHTDKQRLTGIYIVAIHSMEKR